MSLLIFSNNINGRHGTLEWYLNESAIDINTRASSVTEIIADEDELEYIRQKFKNIPYVEDSSEVKWFGDIAQFIAGNIQTQTQAEIDNIKIDPERWIIVNGINTDQGFDVDRLVWVSTNQATRFTKRGKGLYIAIPPHGIWKLISEST